jgi:hypothetical protein
MTRTTARLRQSYGVAFLRYLSRRDELTLHMAYELGRGGLAAGVSLLDLVQIHHCVLVDTLNDPSAGELDDIAHAAAAFLAEVLAPFEMTRRAVLDRTGEETAAKPRVRRQS